MKLPMAIKKYCLNHIHRFLFFIFFSVYYNIMTNRLNFYLACLCVYAILSLNTCVMWLTQELWIGKYFFSEIDSIVSEMMMSLNTMRSSICRLLSLIGRLLWLYKISVNKDTHTHTRTRRSNKNKQNKRTKQTK